MEVEPALVHCRSVIECPPGLALGECPPHHTGRSCELCELGYAPDLWSSNKACKACGGAAGSDGPLIAFVVAGIVVAIAMVVGILRGGRLPRAEAWANLGMAVGLGLTAVQTVGVFAKMNIAWMEPLLTLGTCLEVLTLDIDFLRPGCLMHFSSPVVRYVGSLLLDPSFGVALTTFFFVAKIIVRRRAFSNGGLEARLDNNELINLRGQILSAFYLAIVGTAARTLECRANPDGTASLATYPGVLCWSSSEHVAMLLSSTLPFLWSNVCFIAVLAWAIIVFPGRIRRPDGIVFIRRFGFVFGRFRPERYYFELVRKLQSLSIALIDASLTGSFKASCGLGGPTTPICLMQLLRSPSSS